MLRKPALALTAAVSIGMSAMPTGVAAAHGGGHGGGGFGGGFGGGHSFGAPAGVSHGTPGGGGPSGNRGVVRNTFPGGRAVMNRGVPAHVLENRHIVGNGRSAWIGHHRVHGRHLHGFIAGLGVVYYWYYDDCIVWVDDYGWVNLCGDNYDE